MDVNSLQRNYYCSVRGVVLMATARHTSDRRRERQEDVKEVTHGKHKPGRLDQDKWSIGFLLLLYTLQGIPMGLAASIPMVLQAKKVGYRQQALFSLVSWPFSVKLLWAPLVDALYSRSFGRRKSWLVPSQYVIGVVMLVLSYFVDDFMGEGDQGPPSVRILTLVFFILFVCAATQDIAVDGWALTILSQENVGHASTCNLVGQTAGYFLGYTVFLALESKEFCNTYLRWAPQERGIVDLPSFLFIWGMVFIVVTTLVCLLKTESRERHVETKSKGSILSAYKELLRILKLRPVQSYAVFVLTSEVLYSTCTSTVCM